MSATTSTTPGALSPDAWIDRKQAADLAGCSIDTIRRDEKEHALPTRTGLGGTVLLRVGDLSAIGRISPDVLDPTINAQRAAEAGALRKELAALQAENAKLRADKAELDGRLAEAREQRNTLAEFVDIQRSVIEIMRETARRAGLVA